MGSQVNTQWFQGRLMDKHLSQRKLATMMGLDPAAVSLMLRGKRRMDVSEAGKVAKVLGVHVDEVIRHAGVAVKEPGVTKGRVPVVGWADGFGGEVHMERALGPSVVEAPPGCEDAVALRIQAAEMFDGWLVYFRECEGVSLEVTGRLCVVKVLNGPTMLRAVRRGYEPGYFVLGGWTTERSDSVRLEWAAPVLWMKQ